MASGEPEAWIWRWRIRIVQNGWLYLAMILDLCFRQIAAWVMSKRMTAALTTRALQLAIRRLWPGSGLIRHFEQSSECTDGAYQSLLKGDGVQASMNGVGAGTTMRLRKASSPR